MRVLLVSDLHYDLRKLDWVISQADAYDLIAVAGDLLDISSAVPLDVQIAVCLEWLGRLAALTRVAVCSGNHDLDSLSPEGEKQTAWLQEARATGVIVDGDTADVEGWAVTSCGWWEGPATLGRLKSTLPTTDRALWLWHGPPPGPLAWTGSRAYPDPELPALLAEHQPAVVLCGHIHQAPFVTGGDWAVRDGRTWLFNAGHQIGPIPSAVSLDLEAGTAVHSSQRGVRELALQ